MAIKFSTLGVGSLIIYFEDRRILIDAFNNISNSPRIKENDLILVTHCDGDHFDEKAFPDVRDTNLMIIGTPQIVKPLFEMEKARINQVMDKYPPNHGNENIYETYKIDNLSIKVFQTSHFLNWPRLHASYLIENEGYRIFICGDSIPNKNLIDYVSNCDYFVCNLVDHGFITKSDNPSHAPYHLASQLLKLKTDFKPKHIIGLHLLGFEGTVDASLLNDFFEGTPLSDVIIPLDFKMFEV